MEPKRGIPWELALAPLVLLMQWSWYRGGTFWVSPHAGLLGDAWVLHTMAVNHLQTGVMSYADAHPTLTQMPLYPAFISLIYGVLGEDPRWILRIQMVATALFTPFLVMALRPHLGRWRWAFAFFWVFDIHHLIYSSCLTTEFWLCWLWTWAWLSWSRGRVLQAGVLLGLCVWLKPLSLYLVPFLVSVGLVIRKGDWRGRLRPALLMMLAFFLALTPLLWRNHRATGEFPRYSTISSFNLWYFNIPYHEHLSKGTPLAEARTQQVEFMRQHLLKQGKSIEPISVEVATDRHAHRVALGLSELEYAQLADQLNAEYLKEEFWSYTMSHLLHAPKIFTVSNLSWLKLVHQSFEAHSFGHSPARWWRVFSQGGIKAWLLTCRLWELIQTLLLLSLAGVGIFFCRRRLREAPLQLALGFIAYTTLVSGINVWGRFRFLFMPMLIFLAVLGLRELWLRRPWKGAGET